MTAYLTIAQLVWLVIAGATAGVAIYHLLQRKDDQ